MAELLPRLLIASALILGGGYLILAVGLEFRAVWKGRLVEWLRTFLTASMVQIVIGGVGVLTVLIGALILMR